jgi:hypothetical protein
VGASGRKRSLRSRASGGDKARDDPRGNGTPTPRETNGVVGPKTRSRKKENPGIGGSVNSEVASESGVHFSQSSPRSRPAQRIGPPTAALRGLTGSAPARPTPPSDDAPTPRNRLSFKSDLASGRGDHHREAVRVGVRHWEVRPSDRGPTGQQDRSPSPTVPGLNTFVAEMGMCRRKCGVR